ASVLLKESNTSPNNNLTWSGVMPNLIFPAPTKGGIKNRIKYSHLKISHMLQTHFSIWFWHHLFNGVFQ
ncbi:hypothetical protein SJR89_21295, partial [Aeromonas caviae]|uniref:hypothetical protein n=1 Tax=Aeromonas caviae TaxID=648 RepID=UPI0029D8E067